MVVPFTTPHDTPSILKAGAIVTDFGGMTSHAAGIARELGIPCVVATEQGTALIGDGKSIVVDGSEGCVYELPT